MLERRFYPELESLRGIAAMMVALMHVLQAPLSIDGSPTFLAHASWWGLRVLGNGQGGVNFFFVLSGFVLFHQLSRLPDDWANRLGVFVVGRLMRIYPSAWATLAIFIAIYFAAGVGLTTEPALYEPSSLVRHMLLFTSLINGVMWTLQVELIAVPLIFVLFIVARRFGVKALIASFVLLAALSFTGQWNRLISELPLLQPLCAFVAGMIAWKEARRFEGLSGWWFLAATVGFLSVRPVIGWASNWSLLVESAVAATMIAMLAADPNVGKIARLTNRVLRYYGRISYSFYLLHPLSLLVIWFMPAQLTSVARMGIPPTLLSVCLFVASVIVITPLAHLQYWLIERTGISLGRRMVSTYFVKDEVQGSRSQNA